MSIRRIYGLFYVAIMFMLFTACKKDTNETPANGIELSSVRLKGFAVKEASPVSIDLVHPVIANGTETNVGSINIVLPKGSDLLQLTPLAENVNSDSFVVEPGFGVKTNFKNAKIRYVVRSKIDPAKRVHYDVTIATEPDPVQTNPAVTAFRFLKANNPALPADVEAARIIHEDATISKIYIFVTPGTDYSKLVATVESEGGTLVYSTDPMGVPAQSTDAYPLGGKAIDYTYPKSFYLTVKQPGRSRTYDVIVDVKNPIKFVSEDVTTGYVTTGHSGLLNVTDFVNQGNHPILVTQIAHSNQVPTGLNVIRAQAFIPSGGLKPGDTADVMANVGGPAYPAGVYKTTAMLYPKIFQEPGADNLLQTSSVKITSSIVD
jgi:hypothetical protein